MPVIRPPLDAHVVITAYESRPGHGYVCYSFRLEYAPGRYYSPDPSGSDPLLGRPVAEVIDDLLRRLRKVAPELTYEVL